MFSAELSYNKGRPCRSIPPTLVFPFWPQFQYSASIRKKHAKKYFKLTRHSLGHSTSTCARIFAESDLILFFMNRLSFSSACPLLLPDAIFSTFSKYFSVSRCSSVGARPPRASYIQKVSTGGHRLWPYYLHY